MGFRKGGLSFLNDEIGEFWYALEMTATEADPIVLQDIEAELGKMGSTQLSLENPLGENIELAVYVSNPTNFQLQSEGAKSPFGRPLTTIPVAAYSVLTAQVIYTASGLLEEERTVIKLSHPEAGMWEFQCTGHGTAPEYPEEPIRVSSMCGHSSSNVILFRNPFKTPMLTTFVLTGDIEVPEDAPEGSVAPFHVATRDMTNVVLPPFQELALPVVFVPNKMTEHNCQLEVHALEHSFKWVYPIVGTAEAATGRHCLTLTNILKSQLVNLYSQCI